MEAGVTLLIALFGVIVIIGSLQAGIDWGAEGPRAGFFPVLCRDRHRRASASISWNGLSRGRRQAVRRVETAAPGACAVVIPTAVYVGAMPFIGIYVASIVLIGWFMRWLGKYSWLTVAAVAIGMPVVDLSDVRALVPGPAAKGADRGMARL